MMKLNIRARFPNGRTITLTQLPDTMLYTDLLKELKTKADLAALPHKVTLAGPPRRELKPDDGAIIGCVLQSGDTIIVEPTPNPSSNGRPRRRARAKADRILSKQPDGDDENDVDWTGDDNVPARPPQPKRRKTGFQAKGYRLDGTEVPAVKVVRKKKKAVVDVDNFSMPDMTGALGGEIVKSLQKKPDELDVTGKKFREALQGALQERMAEAEAERRVEAVLAGRYEITRSADGLFRVKYRGIHEKGWTEECDGEELIEYPRELLAAAFKTVIDGGVIEEKERLRMRCMAMVSVRSFWNMVRMFGKDVEGGLRQLVPDADWSFLESRRRMRSEKAKRNDENKAEMGWTSD